MIETKSKNPIHNSQSLHASIVYEQFFLNSNSDFFIFCKNLSSKVFNWYWVVNAAEKFLKRDKKITILTQEDVEDSNFKKILEHKNVAHKVATNNFIKGLNINFSFTSSMFRYEETKEKHSAIVAVAGNEPIIKNLKKNWQYLWSL